MQNTIVFLPHGGGPLPLLGDKNHQEMIEALQQLSATIKRPSAILMISAHWESTRPTLTYSPNPALIYDYHGFPEESYQIEYPALGKPELAEKVFFALKESGFDPELDEQRGFDHGMFVPLKIMYPEADIPCVQLSLLNSLDADEHIKMGAALSELDYEDLLIIGSGMSFHNLRTFLQGSKDNIDLNNEAFEKWLIETCANQNINTEEAIDRLSHWEAMPSARYCHPREEHLLPLHVCYGAAQRPSENFSQLMINHKKVSLFVW